MYNALHGREAWRGPCERDRGRQGAAGSGVLEAGVFGLRQNLTRGNEAAFQGLRLDDHARDMVLDQVAVRKHGLGLCCIHCCKVPADAVAHEGLDLGGRHAGDAAYFGLSILQDRMRHIIPVAHAALVRMRRAHPVAAVVEQAPGQNGGRAPEPDLPGDGVGGARGLHALAVAMAKRAAVSASAPSWRRAAPESAMSWVSVSFVPLRVVISASIRLKSGYVRPVTTVTPLRSTTRKSSSPLISDHGRGIERTPLDVCKHHATRSQPIPSLDGCVNGLLRSARRNLLAGQIAVGAKRRALQQGFPERPLVTGIERLEKLHLAACQHRYRKTVPVEEPAAGERGQFRSWG